MKKYKIAGISFKTKSEIRKYMKDIISSGKLNKSKINFIYELLQYHTNRCWVDTITGFSIRESNSYELCESYDIIDNKVLIGHINNGYTNKDDIIPFSFCISKIPVPNRNELRIIKLEAYNELLKLKIKELEDKLKEINEIILK